MIPIDRALADHRLLGAALGPVETWSAWLALLRAAFGLPLTEPERTFFAAVAGGRSPPTQRVRELWVVAGRRSGKSRMAAAVATYLGAFCRYRLAPGETGHVLVLASTRDQARTVFGYAEAFLHASPVLAREVVDATAEELRLRNRVVIGVHPANFRSIRGRTLAAVVFDEVAFWRDEDAALPDVETYRAVLPALATTGGMLVGISSPYAKRGLLYARHRDYFGRDDPEVLVVQAPSTALNPTLSADIVARAKRDDPEAAQAEWDAEFRADLSTYVDRAVVERLVEAGVAERAYDARHRYVAFVDPSGGQRDSFTLAIAHEEGKRVVLDVLRETRPPFSPADVCDRYCQLLRKYGVTGVTGDAYAGEWVGQAFDVRGVRYYSSELTRSEIYLEALPLLMNGAAALLDCERLVHQIALLERRTTRAGRDVIDHPPQAADDLANAALGALVLAEGTAGAVLRAEVREMMAERLRRLSRCIV